MAASMTLVAVARNGVLFLVAWEVMSVASYFLVTFYDDRPGVLEAGRTYLIATHLGTAFLFVLFILLGRQAGSLDFAAFSRSHSRVLGQSAVPAGGCRFRHEGRLHAVSCLAARGLSRGPQLCRRDHVGRHEQAGHLRPACAC